MHPYSPDEVVQSIVDNATSGKWLSCTFTLVTSKGPFSLGVKAFGRRVEHLEVCGLVRRIPEQRTRNALKQATVQAINEMVGYL